MTVEYGAVSIALLILMIWAGRLSSLPVSPRPAVEAQR
jgi:hypothetical protein